MESVLGDALNRIEALLERIAVALEEKKPEEAKAIVANLYREAESRKVTVATTKKAGDSHAVIKAYIDAYQARYGRKARPDVGGRVQGQIKNLLKDLSAARLIVVVQAYLQMEDEWFKKKGHDFPTLYENLGKVQTALLNGTEKHDDKRYWGKVFGGDNDARNFSDAGTAIASELPRGQLQRGEGSPLLEGPKDDA